MAKSANTPRDCAPIWHRAFGQMVDDLSTKRYGITSHSLMQHAGTAAAYYIRQVCSVYQPIIVLVGPGNNGGDGLVAGRVLAGFGSPVTLVLVGEAAQWKKASILCAKELETCQRLGMTIVTYKKGGLAKIALAHSGSTSTVIIDAVFGLGFHGTIKSPLTAAALSEANRLNSAHVFAIDGPSGMDFDDGGSRKPLLMATDTLTFGHRKPIHVLAPARDYCGQVTCLPIPFAPEAIIDATKNARPWLYEHHGESALQENPWHSALSQSANKYDRGHVLVVGGSRGKLGAPQLSALAALRTGAGWCSLAMPQKDKRDPLECTLEDFYAGGKIDTKSLSAFLKERRVRSVVIGPGMMTSPWTKDLVAILDTFSQMPGCSVVVDAGATAGLLPQLTKAKAPKSAVAKRQWILTPHPGEWQRMGVTLPAPLTEASIAKVRAFADAHHIHLVYKGATPVLIGPDMPAVVTDAGHVRLARAGSGDVLAGVIAAHAAVGCGLATAFLRGYALIAWSARKSSHDFGDQGVLATDMINHLAGPRRNSHVD